MKHYLFASLTIVALFVLSVADAPAWMNLGIAGLLLTPLVFHVDELKRQIEVLVEWAEEGSNELFIDLYASIEKRDEEIKYLQARVIELQQDSTEIQVLKRAGYFHDGNDALSLLAHIDSLTHDLDAARINNDNEYHLKELGRLSVDYSNFRHNILNEIEAIRKVFTYPKITPITTDEQHAQLTRAAVEARLEWMVYLIQKSTETPEDREDRDLEREQESNYNRGLGV